MKYLKWNFAKFYILFVSALLIIWGCTKSNSDLNNTKVAPLENKIDSLHISDSLKRVDSLRVADSIWLRAFEADSIKRVDSIRVADSIRLVIFKTDSIRREDSLRLVIFKTDSIRREDSLRLVIFRTDSIRREDSMRLVIFRTDSIRRADSIRLVIFRTDSIRREDSMRLVIFRTDSIRRADSIRVADSIANLPPPPVYPPVPEPPNQGREVEVGAGFGDLIIDGKTLKIGTVPTGLRNGDKIRIKGGAYNSIVIRNISVPNGERIIIENNKTVSLTGDFTSMDIENVNNVTISGGGTMGVTRGFQFLNNKFRAVKLRGSINNFTLEKMLFKNVSDYVIFYEDNDKRVYTGGAGSYSENLAFLNLDAENVGQFIGIGGEIGTNFTGLVKNIEVAGITCINSPEVGSVVFLGNCENYNVHNNFVDNVNGAINNHNGVFMLRGNGRFYNNTVKNHQGNALRSWLYSMNGANSSSVDIYNNIVYNSRMYSAFELQVPPYIKESALFKPATARLYNNTVGRMNTSKKTFPGRLLDLYNTYSTLELYNNLLFEDNDDIVLNNMSDTKITTNSNNIYKANYYDAVMDLTNFVSKVQSVGAAN